MKKLLKAGALLAMAAALTVAGVFAAQTITWNISSTTSTVSFKSKDVFVNITGNVAGAFDEEGDALAVEQYAGKTYTDEGNLTYIDTEWEIGDLFFNPTIAGTGDEQVQSGHIITITLTFENVGDRTINLSIIPPDLTDTNVSESHTIDGVSPDEDGEDDVLPNTASIAKDTSITFVYSFRLTNFQQDFASAVPLGFEVTMTVANE